MLEAGLSELESECRAQGVDRIVRLRLCCSVCHGSGYCDGVDVSDDWDQSEGQGCGGGGCVLAGL